MQTDLKKLLEPLEKKYNSSHTEALRYYELCGSDLHLLERLYFIMKILFTFKVPTTKEEVNKILNTNLTIIHKSGAIGYILPQYGIIENCYTNYGSRLETHYATQWPKVMISFWQPRTSFKLYEQEK